MEEPKKLHQSNLFTTVSTTSDVVSECVKGELKPKIELISFDSQSDEIIDFRRYLC